MKPAGLRPQPTLLASCNPAPAAKFIAAGAVRLRGAFAPAPSEQNPDAPCRNPHSL